MVTRPFSMAKGGLTGQRLWDERRACPAARMARRASPSLSTLIVAPAAIPAFEFVVAFSRAGEGHRDSGELGALETIELTSRRRPGNPRHTCR